MIAEVEASIRAIHQNASWVVAALTGVVTKSPLKAPGSVLQAAAGFFHKGDDVLVTIADVNNVTVIGHGSRWQMRKSDYTNASKGYSVSEHRHGLTVHRCRVLLASAVLVLVMMEVHACCVSQHSIHHANTSIIYHLGGWWPPSRC
jgi:hypothetical protein